MTETATPAQPGATTVIAQPAPLQAPAVADKLPDGAAAPAADASQATAPLPTATPEAAPNAGAQDDQAKLPETPKPNRAQQRIDEVTRARREAERRADAAERERDGLRQKLRELASRVDPNDADAVQAYRIREAVTAEKIEQADAAARGNAEAAKSLQAQAQFERQQAFMASIAEARQRIPNIDWAMQQFQYMPASEPMADCLATSDRAPELIHYFTTNPQGQAEYLRINEMPAALLGRSLAQIEARITAQPIKRISQAPAPVQTVTGSPASPVADPSQMSNEEYRKWRQSQSR